jgi:DNA adenine methylase
MELEGGIRPAIGRMGGKTRLKKIIVNNYFPKDYINMVYVEPFLGGGSIYFYKEKGNEKEIINDLDKNVYIVMKGLKNYDWDKYKNLVNITMSKEIFSKIKDSNPKNDFGIFIKNLLLFKTSFFSKQKSISLDKEGKKLNMNFDGFKERLSNTTILNKNYKDVIIKYDSVNTFFYLDPPYSMSDEEHYTHSSFDLNELYELLKNIKGKFLLSYDYNKNAINLFKSFTIKIINTTYASTQHIEKRNKKELLIYNY